MKELVVAVVLSVGLIGCGQSDTTTADPQAGTAHSKIATLTNKAIDPDDPNGCQPSMAEIIQAQCEYKLGFYTDRQPNYDGGQISNTARYEKALNQSIATAERLKCGAVIAPALEEGQDNASAAFPSIYNAINCNTEKCDVASSIEYSRATCARFREPKTFCKENSCKTGPSTATPRPIWSISSEKFTLQNTAYADYPMATIYFIIDGDRRILPSSAKASAKMPIRGDYSLLFTCDKVSARILMLGENASEFFKDDNGADIQPSDQFNIDENSASLSGDLYSDRNNGTNKMAVLEGIFAAIRKNSKIKIGKLPEIAFDDADGQLQSMLKTCRWEL